MANITISLDEDLLKAGRGYAKEHNTSLNNLIRTLLGQTVRRKTDDWQEECFQLMDRAKADSEGHHWKREDLYDV